ncbi:MAG: YdcF family protein [Cytophagaceae bacterium]
MRIFLKVQAIILLCLTIVGCLSQKRSYKNLINARKQAPFDAIIVPGVPLEDSAWGNIMKIRVYWSHYLYTTGITNNIIYSGSAVYTPFIESQVMSIYAQSLGIPDSVIHLEKRAEHSTENLYYSYVLARKLGFKNIALATDPFQDKMLRKFRKKLKLEITHIPMVIDTLKIIVKDNPRVDHSPAFVPDFISLTEREGFFERWKGTRGKKIVYEEIK